jgi:hypothetical protein
MSKYGVQDHDTWYCFGCHKSGDIVSFIRRIEHLKSDEDVIRFFKEKYQINYTPPSFEQSLLEILNTKYEKPIMQLDEINIKTSSACRRYLFYVRDKCPDKFEQEFKYIQDFYKRLDDLFYSTPVVNLQDTIYNVEKELVDRKKQL